MLPLIDSSGPAVIWILLIAALGTQAYSCVIVLWQINDCFCPSESQSQYSTVQRDSRWRPQFWLLISNKIIQQRSCQKSLFHPRSEKSSQRFQRFGNNNNNNHNNKKTSKCINMGFLRGLLGASWIDQDTHGYTPHWFFFFLHLHL